MKGWAFGIMNTALNPPHLKDSEPHRRIDEWIERYDDGCKVGDSPLVGVGSCSPKGDPYVVWIKDNRDGSYSYRYSAKSGSFGGLGRKDTLEEAIESYDAIRGAKPEQTSLFG